MSAKAEKIHKENCDNEVKWVVPQQQSTRLRIVKSWVQIPPNIGFFTSLLSSITFRHNKSYSVLKQVPRTGAAE